MAWYNSRGEQAPTAIQIERNGKTIWRSNPVASTAWREENGYIYSERPAQLTPPRTEFTKMEIRLAMRALGWEGRLDALIASSERATKEWRDAQVIDLNYPGVREALAAAGVTAAEIAAIRQEIEHPSDPSDPSDLSEADPEADA